MDVQFIMGILKHRRLPLHEEKSLQLAIHNALLLEIEHSDIRREFILDEKNIIDFLVFGKIGIEVKIKANKRAIYRQCCQYCEFSTIETLILVTNTSMGFPPAINGKDCYVHNLGKAWL